MINQHLRQIVISQHASCHSEMFNNLPMIRENSISFSFKWIIKFLTFIKWRHTRYLRKDLDSVRDNNVNRLNINKKLDGLLKIPSHGRTNQETGLVLPWLRLKDPANLTVWSCLNFGTRSELG